VPAAIAVWTPLVLFGLMSLWMFRNSLAWPGDNPVSRAVSKVERLIELGRSRRAVKAPA
jgi:lipopolysaccharide export system permease protein